MESIFHNAELERINSESDHQAGRRFASALDVPRWVSAMVDSRPFADGDAMAAASLSVASPLTEDEIDRALHVHPRIGERPGGTDQHAAQARAEQSGIDITSADVATALREGNRAYESRFGRVFLIRAAGRDATDILAALEERLGNDTGTELAVVERQLREIAVHRLTGGGAR